MALEKNSNGVQMGKSSINGGFSIAMFDYQRVIFLIKLTNYGGPRYPSWWVAPPSPSAAAASRPPCAGGPPRRPAATWSKYSFLRGKDGEIA